MPDNTEWTKRDTYNVVTVTVIVTVILFIIYGAKEETVTMPYEYYSDAHEGVGVLLNKQTGDLKMVNVGKREMYDIWDSAFKFDWYDTQKKP